MRVLALPRDEMAGILNGLTNLNLEPQHILGDRTNVQNAMRKAKEEIDLQKNSGSDRTNVIVVSSGSESNDAVPVRFQPPKAVRLGDLSRRASTASDNQTLARLVKEFVEVLRMNSSRTLTKEAFVFLDVLYKQLDNPSVFVQPARFVSFVCYGPNVKPDEKVILGHHEGAHLMNKFQRKSLLISSWEWLRV
jgi:casein kinase 1